MQEKTVILHASICYSFPEDCFGCEVGIKKV